MRSFGFITLLAVALLAVFASVASAANPTLSINPVTKGELPSTKITGTVDPGSYSIYAVPEYRVAGSAEGWTEGTVAALEPGEGPTPVSLETGPLSASTVYEARIGATAEGELFTSPPPNPTFETEAVEPAMVTMEPPTAVTSRTVHLSGHINPGAPAGEHPGYDVTWSFVCTPECSSAGGQIAADSESHLVEEEVIGLVPGTTYHVVLRATNGSGSVESEPSFEFTAPAALPIVEGLAVHSVTTGEATLTAAVVPGGAPTTYHFEFVPRLDLESEGWSSPAVRSTPEAGPLPADNVEHIVSATVSELSPGTPYAWRVVATNAAGEASNDEASFATQDTFVPPQGGCTNEAFRQFAGGWLPDCRAYEQVTPDNKNGIGVEGAQDLLGASPSGSSIIWASSAYSGTPEPGQAGHQEISAELSSLAAGTWGATRLLPPYALGEYAYFLGLTSDQRYALVEAGNEIGQGTHGLYLIDTADGSVTTVLPREAETSEPYAFAGASTNDQKIFFETRNRLQTSPAGAPGYDNLYMWNRESGGISLVGTLPVGEGGTAPLEGSFGGAYAWFEGTETESGGALYGQYVEANHAISEDGARVYFTAGGSGQLFAREGLGSGNPTTVRVSEPNPDAEDPFVEETGEELPAAFQEATPEGQEAFFLSRQKLTTHATTGRNDQGRDLYRYDAANGELVDLTPDPGQEGLNGVRVKGLLGVSESGSSGYFVAEGLLPVERQAGPEAPREGPEVLNIYRFFEAGGQLRYDFVGPIIPADRDDWSPGAFLGSGVPGTTRNNAKSSRVTPDGQTLLFTSHESSSAEGSINIYRYAAAENAVDCVSCNPTGEASQGDATLSTTELNFGILPRSIVKSLISRNLSADGTRVFFTSPSPLLTTDTNGVNGCPHYNPLQMTRLRCEDAYEWEAPGAPGGSCKVAEVDGGCVYLLSAGESEEPSYFIDASVDGSSAFIATESKLVPTDKDSLFDIYDARVDGGLASQQFVPPNPCSSGEACRGTSGAASPTTAPGTSTFQGPGNIHTGKVKPKKKRCRKGSRKCRSGKKKGHAKKPKQQGHKSHKHAGRGAGTTKKGDRK